MKNGSWESFQLFIAVARAGGLTGAAARSGLSPATLGRRMTELERNTGLVLFNRSQTGYTLTPEGQDLMDMLRDMEAAVARVDAWKSHERTVPLVRLALGTWNAWLVAENFPALCGPSDDLRLELTIAEQRAQLAFRENDIGIRAFEPQERNLATRKVGEVAYAAYRLRNSTATTRERWLAVTEDNAVSRYLRWPYQNKADGIAVTVSRAFTLRDLALAGAGTAVLPCFVGDLEPRLERAGEEITELRHSQWIVMNNDDRHRPEIRLVADRLFKLMKSHAELYAGKRAHRTLG